MSLLCPPSNPLVNEAQQENIQTIAATKHDDTITDAIHEMFGTPLDTTEIQAMAEDMLRFEGHTSDAWIRAIKNAKLGSGILAPSTLRTACENGEFENMADILAKMKLAHPSAGYLLTSSGRRLWIFGWDDFLRWRLACY